VYQKLTWPQSMYQKINMEKAWWHLHICWYWI